MRELDQARAQRHGIACEADLDRDAKLDLLMGLVVGPQLGRERPCFVCDYPASQAALARLKPGSPPVAARFELYLDGIELANGFHELGERRRTARALRRRTSTRARARGQVEPPLDERLLAALERGTAGLRRGRARIRSAGRDRARRDATRRRDGVHHRQCLSDAGSSRVAARSSALAARQILAGARVDAQRSRLR